MKLKESPGWLILLTPKSLHNRKIYKEGLILYCMKVHKYQVVCYGSILEFTHGEGETQTRLYIPNKGILGFRKEADFFTDDPEAIAEAEKAVSGKLNTNKREETNYCGQVELPDEAIARVIFASEALNQTRKLFQESAKTLIDLVRE